MKLKERPTTDYQIKYENVRLHADEYEVPYIETSAKNGTNVAQTFYNLTKSISAEFSASSFEKDSTKHTSCMISECTSNFVNLYLSMNMSRVFHCTINLDLCLWFIFEPKSINEFVKHLRLKTP